MPIFLLAGKLGGIARENFPKLAIRRGSFAVTFVAPTKSSTLPSASNGVNGLAVTSTGTLLPLRSGNVIYSGLWVSRVLHSGFAGRKRNFSRSKRANGRVICSSARQEFRHQKKELPQRAPSTGEFPRCGGASSATRAARTFHLTLRDYINHFLSDVPERT